MIKQLGGFNAGLSVFVLLVMFCLLFPTSLWAQASDSEEANQAQGPETSSPFSIKKTSQFGCAEVDEVAIGGTASHEITVDPRRVERCLREKVGTRFHECKKLKIIDATADWNGIITLDTKEGPVRFWFEDHGSDSSGEAKRIMVWSWPDTEKLYMCAAISSKR